MKIAIATCQDFPNLDVDDQLFRQELVNLGFDCEPVIWNSGADWNSYDHIIVRDTWDYHKRLPEFLKWLDVLQALNKKVWNPIPLMRWNTDKSYLHDLEKRGIPVIPTLWIEASGETPQLDNIVAATGWQEAILKPAVSAGAFLTVMVKSDRAGEYQSTLEKILDQGNAMLQPFLPEIQNTGEYSFLFFGGKYQYTVLKTPKAGDFRVQAYYDSITKRVIPSEAMILQAQKVIEVLYSSTLYARVDMVELEGRMHLMEVELIEPTLFLAFDDGAAKRLTDVFCQMSFQPA